MDTGETVGYMELEDLQWFSYSATSSSWTHALVLFSYVGSGTLTGGFETQLQSSCFLAQGICSESSTGSPDPQTLTVLQDSSYEFEWTEYDQGASSTTAGASNVLDPYLGIEFDGSTAVGGPFTFQDSGLTAGRCDTIATPTDGCIDENYAPVVTFDSTANPLVAPVAQHIYDAQTGGLIAAWGVPPIVKSNGQYLTRDMNPADATANNKAACASLTIPPGDNCDEFPMATTYEGAAFNSDYSAAPVPSAANSSQGGILSNFYSSNRVIDSDLFLVKAILLNGTASW